MEEEHGLTWGEIMKLLLFLILYFLAPTILAQGIKGMAPNELREALMSLKIWMLEQVEIMLVVTQ